MTNPLKKDGSMYPCRVSLYTAPLMAGPKLSQQSRAPHAPHHVERRIDADHQIRQ